MSKSNSGLGKGFDALMPKDFDTTLLIDAGERIQNLLITTVEPNLDQPRKLFDEDSLQGLAASIKQYGVLQPLIVSPGANNKFIIIAGERRWRACKLAGLSKVPAIVRDQKQLEQIEVALIENVQRVDLSPLEQAVSIERLHQQFNKSYKEIAKRLGKAETTISNIVRLLQLPPIAREALQAGLISEGHARAILALKESAKQTELLSLIQRHGWSVRQAEQYVTSYKQGAANKTTIQKRIADETPQTKQIGKLLNTKVSLRRTAKGGRLEIHFKSDKELDQLINKIKNLSS